MNNKMKHEKITEGIIAYYKHKKVMPLQETLPSLIALYEESLKDDNDKRCGHETYGYNNVFNDMLYISDRWNASFRLRWLIDGIENGHFEKAVSQ